MKKIFLFLLTSISLTVEADNVYVTESAATTFETKYASSIRELLFPFFKAGNIFHPLATDLHIFWASESAGPGEEIAVQGHFSENAVLCLAMNDVTQYIQLPILSHQQGFIKASLPNNLPLGVYQIWIMEGGGRSSIHYINQAVGDCFNSPDVYAKASLSVKGRNLIIPGKTPSIRFVSREGVSLSATYLPNGSSKFKINFTAPPQLVTGASYSVYVSNGSGGNVAETKVVGDLLAIAPATDTLNLNVAWHARFVGITKNVYNVKTDSRLVNRAVGNGVGNDLPAIQSALNRASADGGGTVYLPAGSYLCTGGGFWGMQFPSNVILKGAGKGLTILKYGVGTAINKFVGAINKQQVGICNLSIQCQDATGAFGAGLFTGENIFFQNIQWDLKKGDWLEFTNSKKIAIIDCDFNQGANSLIHGPTSFSKCEYITMKRNNLMFVMGGINTLNSSKCFVEDNMLIRDVSIPVLAGSVIHLIICEFTKDALFLNNKILVGNGSIIRNSDGSPIKNDGESIISENGGSISPDLDHGLVSSATSLSLTDVSKAWPVTFLKNPVIGIIKGKGAGQVRNIISRTSTTINLTTAWDVVPDNTSAYAIFNFGLERVTFLNNEIRDQQRGITLYHNPMQKVDIVGNRLINAGSIDITTTQSLENGKSKFTPVYNVEIDGNYVDGATDPYNGVSIGIQAIQHIIPQSWGTVCTNLRIVRNTLVGAVPNKKVIQDETFPTGYHNYLVYHTAGTNYVNEGIPVILGTVISGNTSKNVEKSVYINTGSYHTSITRMIQQNVVKIIDDNKLNGSLTASVGTFTDTATLALFNQYPVTNAGIDQTVLLPTNSVTLNGTGSDPGGTITSYVWTTVSGPSIPIITSPNSASTTVSGLIQGSYIFRLMVRDNNVPSASATDDVQVTVTSQAAGGSTTIKINAGGQELSTSLGVFSADANFSPNPGSTYAVTSPIGGTTDDAIYQTERYGTNGTFSYAFLVANGTYTVKLHFAELYWSSAGKRLFDITMEGVKVKDNYDIYAKAGALTATTETFQVNVADGVLNLNFSALAADGGVDQPKVSAIEIISLK